MASDTPTIDSDAVHAYVEGYLPEEDALAAARRRADQLGAGLGEAELTHGSELVERTLSALSKRSASRP